MDSYAGTFRNYSNSFFEKNRSCDIARLEKCIEKHLTYLIDNGQSSLICKHHILTHYPNLIKKHGPRDMFPDKIHISALQFMSYGSIQFRKGFFIIEGREVFEIAHVIESENDYFIFCVSYTVAGFVALLHSIEIRRSLPESYRVFKISDLKHIKTYSRTILHNKHYIIAETLDVLNEF